MTRSCLIWLVCVFSLGINAQEKGPLYGIIQSRVLGPGTYAVIDNLYLPAGDTLMINPPCRFVFKGYYEFKVDGRLMAKGTPDAEISFLGEDNTKWMGITMGELSTTSEISYCNIAGATTGIHISRGSPWIHHCHFSDNRAAINCWNGAWPLISNNNFVKNEDAINNHSSRPYLFNNVFAFNRNWGIWGTGKDESVYSHNAFWRNGRGRRSFFKDDQWRAIPPLEAWAEMERDPKFVGAACRAIRTVSPLVQAGRKELSNEKNWHFVFNETPDIGTGLHEAGMAKRKAGAPLIVFLTGLSQNTPNPFNPITTIQYEIGGLEGSPDKTPVRLAVFNAKGQMIRNLVSGKHPPGRYKAKWNARDDNGHKVASGQYYCRLKTPGYVFVKRMALLK